ncbi:MAG: tagaturonate reductase [Sphingobacteriales bacterium]|nr:MAG: tagaturonate reductase [Sphingobacteriales bacterium]
MQLSITNISKIKAQENLIIPEETSLQLPEKVLQFGTGVLLRGLPDHLINIANRQGFFNGRIVVVKSTSNGDTDAYTEQNSLYTLAVRGIDNGEKIAYDEIISSVSRVLSAQNDWEEILQCAANPDMQLIISNTTEVGIVMEKDNVHASPPQTFPGKVLAFLYHRFKIFNGDADKGMVIVPTELIPDNADKLLSIVLEQAHQHGFEIAFIEWLENHNYFCNSLVDRIVPGRFNKQEQAATEAKLGYKDELMIMSEHYSLWAIQTDSAKVKETLSFAQANPGMVLAADIEKFKELKVRLLNGSHTFSCGLAVLAGFKTVKEAMADDAFNLFITRLMQDEIADAIVSESISKEEAIAFSGKVLDRYRNPFIEHQWSSICMNYSSKMFMRNLPLFYQYAEKKSAAPALISLGMAAHILFMRSQKKNDASFYGDNGEPYLISDPNIAWYAQAWQQNGKETIVASVLANKELWQSDLNEIAGFTNEVNYWLQQLLENGAKKTLQHIQTKTPAE